LARAWAAAGRADLLADLAAAPIPLREVTLLGTEPLRGDGIAACVSAVRAAAGEMAEPPLIRIQRDWSAGDPRPRALEAAADALGAERAAAPPFLHGALADPAALEGAWSGTLARLADRGWPLSAEVWLLAGRNDDVAMLRALLRRLMALRVRPYYLVLGEWLPEGLRVPEPRALELVRGLRGWISGLAVPQLIREDAAGRREPLVPGYVQSMEADGVTVRDYAGRERRYANPRGGAGEESREG
jgi:hypothetical protein